MPLGPFWGFFPARPARRRLSGLFPLVLAFCWLLRLKIPDQFAESEAVIMAMHRITLRTNTNGATLSLSLCDLPCQAGQAASHRDNPRSSRWLRGQPRGSSLSTP